MVHVQLLAVKRHVSMQLHPNGKKNVIEKYLPVTVKLLRRLSVHGGSYTLITTVDTVNLFA